MAKEQEGFAALFFPERGGDTFVMHTSSPPPLWLGDEDMTRVVVNREGVYCLFFLVSSKPCGEAAITVNGREIRGSFSKEKGGEISGSAVCSIRRAALPCALGIETHKGAGGGILIVAGCEV